MERKIVHIRVSIVLIECNEEFKMRDNNRANTRCADIPYLVGFYCDVSRNGPGPYNVAKQTKKETKTTGEKGKGFRWCRFNNLLRLNHICRTVC
jgi:hypothetical protein